jgi:tRNA pseudouridine32 synthase/23S rRNA pseudouridine746 synthase
MGDQTMKLKIAHTATEATPSCASLLTGLSGLSKQRIKDAMSKGAVTLKRGKQTKRIRRAETPVKVGDLISLNYDDSLLALKPPMISCLDDRMGYSVWFKPAGIMSQGNQFGDHMSILRIIETQLHNKREVFPVHRLDRETRGLIIVAHNKKMAAILSEMFQQHKIEKCYQAIVLGETPIEGTINKPLDDKEAITHFTRVSYDSARNTSQLDIRLETGRTHQIRRHLEMINHPIMGDPKYGEGNKNRQGLLLVAYRLSYTCPIRHQAVTIALPEPFPAKGDD